MLSEKRMAKLCLQSIILMKILPEICRITRHTVIVLQSPLETLQLRYVEQTTKKERRFLLTGRYLKTYLTKNYLTIECPSLQYACANGLIVSRNLHTHTQLVIQTDNSELFIILSLTICTM